MNVMIRISTALIASRRRGMFRGMDATLIFRNGMARDGPKPPYRFRSLEGLRMPTVAVSTSEGRFDSTNISWMALLGEIISLFGEVTYYLKLIYRISCYISNHSPTLMEVVKGCAEASRSLEIPLLATSLLSALFTMLNRIMLPYLIVVTPR
jgi:hypothetical protein